MKLYCDIKDARRLSLVLDWPHLAQWRTTYHARDRDRRTILAAPKAMAFQVVEKPRYWPGVLTIEVEAEIN